MIHGIDVIERFRPEEIKHIYIEKESQLSVETSSSWHEKLEVIQKEVLTGAMYKQTKKKLAKKRNVLSGRVVNANAESSDY